MSNSTTELGPRFYELVEGVYDTVIDLDLWPGLLQEIAEYLGARYALVFDCLDGGPAKLSVPFYSESIQDGLIEKYLERFSEFEASDQTRFAELSGQARKIKLVNDIEAFQNEALYDRPTVQALSRYGIRSRSGAVLNKDSWNVDRLALLYDDSRSAANDEEKMRAAYLLPHMAKSLRMGRALIDRQRSEKANLQFKLNRLNFGVAIVRGIGNDIVLINDEFQRIIEETGLFRVTHQNKIVINVSDQAARSQYQRLMEEACEHGRTGAHPRSQALIIAPEGEERGGAIFVEISPATKHKELGRLPENSRVISVLDCTINQNINPQIISRFFGLSKSEEEILASLAQGHSNAEIAELRNRSLETIKSQTKALYRKTYTRNRTELVQLSLSLESPFATRWFDE